MNSSANVLLFGIARDLTGQSSVLVPLAPDTRVSDLLTTIHKQYPALLGIQSLLVAVNGEYAEADQPLTPQDEIALIPPVSGG
ncbi:MAG: MoaD/ThiS family protein [Spirosoma sp.]|nr:MoaD/ThiS family protein [Spirosoma sp.]